MGASPSRSLDLETTGIDVESARIVTAHVGLLDETGEVLHRRDWLVDPGEEIPSEATAIHGISTEQAREHGMDPARAVAAIVAQLRSLFERVSLWWRTTRPTTSRCSTGRPADTASLRWTPLARHRPAGHRQGRRQVPPRQAHAHLTATHYGVNLIAAHDAGADAIAAGRVAQALARIHADALAVEAAELHLRQVDWCREQAADFQEYMRRERDPQFTTSGDWPLR